MKEATLICIGTPLDEGAPLCKKAVEALEACDLIVGESRAVTSRLLKQAKLKENHSLFFLDNIRDLDRKDLENALTQGKKSGLKAGLLSDTGMPILFDPGAEVLRSCVSLGYRIRSTEGATSWGSACALSGMEPPFWVEGFLPRDTEERTRRIKDLRAISANIVLLETPYRFQAFLKQLLPEFSARESFLAWEITKDTEQLLYGSLDQIAKSAQRLGLEKGEFILILGHHSPKRRR
jgi:16S rRNA (cytidine1402-2'-O)-methyltransferase